MESEEGERVRRVREWRGRRAREWRMRRARE